jgi:hypothetical protein
VRALLDWTLPQMPGSGEHARTQALPTALAAGARTESRTENNDDEPTSDERVEALPGQRAARPSNGDRPAPAARPGRLAAADGRA